MDATCYKLKERVPAYLNGLWCAGVEERALAVREKNCPGGKEIPGLSGSIRWRSVIDSGQPVWVKMQVWQLALIIKKEGGQGAVGVPKGVGGRMKGRCPSLFSANCFVVSELPDGSCKSGPHSIQCGLGALAPVTGPCPYHQLPVLTAVSGDFV